MATITKTIGFTGRDYSTITLWEDDLDDMFTYGIGDDAVGECYADAVFSENVTLNGGDTVGLDSVTLTVATGERHDGTAGNGARIGEAGVVICIVGISNVVVEWLEVYNDAATSNTVVGIETSGNYETGWQIRNCIIHQIIGRNNYSHVHGIQLAYGSPCDILNCLIYDIDQPVSGGAGAARGISGHFNASHKVLNCTVYDINSTLGTLGKGVELQGVIKNSISVGVGGDCIDWDSSYSGAVSYNLSSDSTATGTGSLTGKTAANQFVSTSPADLHLKDAADALRVAHDLETTPTGVNFDIDGYDRHAEDSTWDIGADQCDTCSLAASGGVAWSDFKPADLKKGWLTSDSSDLKPGCTTDSYSGGNPSASGDLKSSLIDSDGNLKEGIVEDGEIKKSVGG